MKKVYAGALYYSIFISLMIEIICLSYILHSHFQDKYIIVKRQKLKAVNVVNSAVEWYKTFPGIVEYNEIKLIEIFENYPKANIEKRRWGAYDFLRVSSDALFYNYSVKYMTGCDLHSSEPVALYLADQKQFLSVCGETVISGNCYLPRKGIKKARIEGQSFKGEKLVNGIQSVSLSSLPEINPLFYSHNENYLLGKFNSRIDSIIDLSFLLKRPKFKHSFNKKTIIFQSVGDIELKDIDLSGNIIISTNGSIEVYPSCKFDNIIIYANKINIHSGFEGNAQFFAINNITVDDECKLIFPSFLGVICSSVNNISIDIGARSHVEGGVFLLHNQKSLEPPFMQLSDSSSITGQVYCNGKVQLEGEIIGSLYCNSFVLKTPSSTYENHLLNSRIDFNSLSRNFAGYEMFSNQKLKKKLIQLLD